jgi:hypothetical protein
LPIRLILASAPNESSATDFQTILELSTQENKSEIENTASDMELKWQDRDPNQYADMMVLLCGVLYSNDISKNNEMHIKYSEKAINHLGGAFSEISVENEISLLLCATKSSGTLQNLSKQDNWPEDREIVSRPYFRALARLLSKIDPDWDINRSLHLPERPLNRSDETNKVAKKYHEQFNLRKRKQSLLPEFHDYFMLLYSCSDIDSASFDIEAFNADLSKSVKDKKIKLQIMEVVSKPKDQLYTLREEEEKIAPKYITEQLTSMSAWLDLIEMPQDEQMCSNIQNALTSARQLWKECQDLVNSKKVHFSTFANTPQYSGSLKLEGQKIGYNFVFKSAAMELLHCIKDVYEDEAGRNIIRDKSYELIFYPDGSNIEFYLRGSSKEQIHFRIGNKMKTYVLQIGDEEWYSISWDQNGKIVKEHTYTRRIGP